MKYCKYKRNEFLKSVSKYTEYYFIKGRVFKIYLSIKILFYYKTDFENLSLNKENIILL